jgi:hypothetical protein
MASWIHESHCLPGRSGRGLNSSRVVTTSFPVTCGFSAMRHPHPWTFLGTAFSCVGSNEGSGAFYLP